MQLGANHRTFFPIEFFGIPIKRFACGQDQPVGCIGWQGIIPAKAAKMAAISTDLMTRDLFKIEEVSSPRVWWLDGIADRVG